ncbi:hypothetical protein [Bilophila wadsworthia]|uniref:hypothetical protein n=1 Tax=Bilophila wadsworthia TaxID=35833 RepID=UPI002431C708|nr:hypothetical protein [Bilophila wadsworthia]
MKFEENEHSKIFDNKEFGYWKITVLQPLLTPKGQPQKDKKGQMKPDMSLPDTEQVPLALPRRHRSLYGKRGAPFAPTHGWMKIKPSSAMN